MEVGYILFVHLTDREAAWQALERHARTLSIKLADPIRPGMLMLFVDPGWTDLLNVIGEDFNAKSLAAGFGKIAQCVERIEKIVESHPAFHEGETSRLRLITADTLNPIINNLRGNKPGVEAQQLRRYLVSDKPTLRYDTTKVAEAIIRIRHLGTGIPIMRLDWDALLNDQTLTTCWDSLVTDIPARCREYLKDAKVRSFMISGGYLANRDLRSEAPQSFDDFNTSYATRVFPSLFPTRQVIDELNRIKLAKLQEFVVSLEQLTLNPSTAQLADQGVRDLLIGLKEVTAGPSSANSLSPSSSPTVSVSVNLDDALVATATQFLHQLVKQLKLNAAHLADANHHLNRQTTTSLTTWTDKINECRKALSDDPQLLQTLAHNLSHGLFHHATTQQFYDAVKSLLGSDHEKSVISGAGLVLSDGAIIDLPPFSNCRENVMWIDDYLKYSLHDSLGHLSVPSVIVRRDHPRVSRFVYKDRVLAGQGNLRTYVLGDYIPVLVRGILMDAWVRVREDVRSLKNHVETRNRREYTPFCAALERALRRGAFTASERDSLREKLEIAALTRLTTLIRSWSPLVVEGEDRQLVRSFAALWVRSDRKELNDVLKGLTKPHDHWLGWGLLEFTGAAQVSRLSDLREPIAHMVRELIEDACVYIEWALEWPKFIQSVRAVPKGTMELDVDFS